MKRLLLLTALLALTGPALAGPMSPTTQRPTVPDTGERLFYARCGYCHLAGGTGTMMLSRRLGPDRSLLAARTDLKAPYVKGVVRHGLNSMPPLTRVEVTDAELDAIAAWLAGPKAAR